MAKTEQSPSVDVLLQAVDVLPVIGGLLGAATRFALEEKELRAVQKCLANALWANDETAPIPSYWDRYRPWRSRKEKALRKEVAADLMAAGGLLEEPTLDSSDMLTPDPGEQPGESEAPHAPTIDDESRIRLLASVHAVMRRQLNDAMAVEELTPWTLRLPTALAMNAEARWHILNEKKHISSEEGKEKRRVLATVILNRDVIKDERLDLGRKEFSTFGRRVGLHFTANLAAHSELDELVKRLDQRDKQRADLALVTAAQGLRVALIATGIVLGVAAAALVDIAVQLSL